MRILQTAGADQNQAGDVQFSQSDSLPTEPDLL